MGMECGAFIVPSFNNRCPGRRLMHSIVGCNTGQVRNIPLAADKVPRVHVISTASSSALDPMLSAASRKVKRSVTNWSNGGCPGYRLSYVVVSNRLQRPSDRMTPCDAQWVTQLISANAAIIISGLTDEAENYFTKGSEVANGSRCICGWRRWLASSS
jgi:hypothetical protein